MMKMPPWNSSYHDEEEDDIFITPAWAAQPADSITSWDGDGEHTSFSSPLLGHALRVQT